MNWISVKDNQPALTLSKLVTNGKYIAFTHAIDLFKTNFGFEVTHWIYLKDVPLPPFLGENQEVHERRDSRCCPDK